MWVFASSTVSGVFVTVDFSGVALLAPRPTSNVGDQGLCFVWPVPFDLSDTGVPYQELTLPPT
jgi:hypothetical protein